MKLPNQTYVTCCFCSDGSGVAPQTQLRLNVESVSHRICDHRPVLLLILGLGLTERSRATLPPSAVKVFRRINSASSGSFGLVSEEVL